MLLIAPSGYKPWVCVYFWVWESKVSDGAILHVVGFLNCIDTPQPSSPIKSRHLQRVYFGVFFLVLVDSRPKKIPRMFSPNLILDHK